MRQSGRAPLRPSWTGVEHMSERLEQLDIAGRSPSRYLLALRPHQWLKNILVFLPMLAAHQLDGATLTATLLAFLSFSMVASAVYVVNDLFDLAADRAHPRKKNRPFASGSIPVSHGVWMALGLVTIGGCFAGLINLEFTLVVAGYFILSTAYSIYFKKQIIIDICVLAGLYTIRIVAGSVAAAVPMSEWLLAFSAFFFLSLAAVKRQAELVDMASREKLGASGRGYKADDLPIVSMVAIGAGYVSVLVLALYINSPTVVSLYANPEALWGVCAVLLYWLTRSIMVAHRGQMHDDPVVYAAKDPVSQLCLLVLLGFGVVGVWN
jgi:4-hydroxybenzoate polyprenyltransferase